LPGFSAAWPLLARVVDMTTTRLTFIAVAGCAALLGGCGNGSSSSTHTSALAAQRAPAVPAPLLGRYTATLQRSDLPANPPPELTEGSRTWKLTVAPSGGIDNGPAITIANAKLGVLESSNFAAQAGTLLLRREDCEAGGNQHFYDNRYRYTMSGGTLRFTTISNGCKDRVAETILTSRPWHRTQGNNP
jgi:hypothetical protein